ncbi:hypothetical protein MBLNU13_g04505t1 [Cladosporium sp. NU13]
MNESNSAAWQVQTQTGINGLVFEEGIADPNEIGHHDCLITIEASSLNYRDIMIANGTYPFPLSLPVIPGSDASGTVLAIGPKVTRFCVGDNVCTHILPTHLDGSFTPQKLQIGLGGSMDGTLRPTGVFSESTLVRMPKTLDFREASTLPCAGLTAWNALMGLPGRPLKKGDYVLTLGSGGVSLFALQIAVAAGATVVGTTSSKAKADRLKALGAHHVINYKEDPNWGSTARQLTPEGAGFDFVIEVGGASTLKQSVAATKMEGILAVVGIVGGVQSEEDDREVPSLLQAWLSCITVRGIAVGSRAQLEDFIAFVESCGLEPVVEDRVFGLKEVKEAYEFLSEQRNFGKVVIDCQKI